MIGCWPPIGGTSPLSMHKALGVSFGTATQIGAGAPMMFSRAGPDTYSDESGDMCTQAGPHSVVNTRTGSSAPQTEFFPNSCSFWIVLREKFGRNSARHHQAAHPWTRLNPLSGASPGKGFFSQPAQSALSQHSSRLSRLHLEALRCRPSQHLWRELARAKGARTAIVSQIAKS